MISFENDYSTGAHPRILEALAATNLEPAPGYGGDRFCESAAARIRTACDDETADVFFLMGGTQTNAVVISALLAGHEGVIAADTGHIAVHEAGAIEATGHKVLTVPECDGKLRAADVKAYLEAFYADASYTHMVFPGMVFIAHPSELGTLYSLAELEELSALCRRYQIPLYLDGARLAYGLAAPDTDVTLADIARLADAFYIGGTKCGALCGEATPSSTAPCWPRGVCSACSSTRCSPITCTAKWDVWPSQPPTSCAASCARPGAPSSAKAPPINSSWFWKMPRSRRWPSASASARGKSSGTAAPSSASSPAGPPPPTTSRPWKRPCTR